MIFVTIGTQEPFDRLIRAVDQYAPKWGGERVIAQMGVSEYSPRNIEQVDYLSPEKYAEIFDESRLIISHAGTGTILTALLKRKPILVMPRIASLGEHRNEHQMATAVRFGELGYLKWAKNEIALVEILDESESYEFLLPSKIVTERASQSLLDDLREFIL